MTIKQIEEIKECVKNGLVQYTSHSDDYSGLKFNIEGIEEDEDGTVAFLETISTYIVLEEEKFEDFTLFRNIKKEEENGYSTKVVNG